MAIAPEDAGIKYRAFISYSHRDERWAKWLQRALEAYRVPSRLVGTRTSSGVVPRRLAPVFRDRSDLSSSTDLGATLRESLAASANMIVICSPTASVSRWLNEEIKQFKLLGRSHRIFCLIVEGEPNASDLPSREAEECFAPALRETGIEPIAADARPNGDGKANAKIKIIAGLLDVGFDDLKRREQRRRLRRMTAITSLAVAVMLMTTLLAIDAWIARRAAERRQKQAEALVSFMLGDLNDKLRQVQRLDILEAVDTQAMAYFLSLPTTDVTDQSLGLRAKALMKIGDIREDQGQLPGAIESYRAASGLAAELLRRAPDDPEREASFAETLNDVGKAYWFQGQAQDALGSFQQAIALLERSTMVRPSDEQMAVLAFARTNAGRVFETRGDFAAARTLYEAVLSTFKALAAHPEGSRWQSNLGDAYDNLGKLALEQGRLTQAVAAYRDVRRIKAQLLAEHPSDRDIQENLLVSDAILGRALALCGDDEAAVHYSSEAVGNAEALMRFDATQADWREEFALYSLQLSALARRGGRFAEASAYNRQALRVLSELVATDKTNLAWSRELAGGEVESARLQLAQGDLVKAAELLESAMQIITSERAADPEGRDLRLLEAQARIVIGQAAVMRHDAPGARDQWARARDVIAPATRIGADPNFLATLASADVLLDDTAAASVLSGRLAAMGYHTRDFDSLLIAKKLPVGLKSDAPGCGIADTHDTHGETPQ